MKRFLIPCLVLLAAIPACKLTNTRPPWMNHTATVAESNVPKVIDPYVNVVDFGETFVHLKWKIARDNNTVYTNLDYCVYVSTNAGMTNLAMIERIGTPYTGFQKHMKELTVTNLTPNSVYYFAVVVRNPSGGMAAYQMKRQATIMGARYTETIPAQPPAGTLPGNWWKTRVFYECFVRMYSDSDGDGMGDFEGLISKLDYLQSLGIGGLWLLPVFESSDNDYGNCVTDFRDVESDFGTMDDFKRLIAEAHKRNIGVVVGINFNNTSSEHPFFKEASSGANSQYGSWYLFEPVYPASWNDPRNPVGSWYYSQAGFYYATGDKRFPELNFRNRSVWNYFKDTVKFWLNAGVDGFRVSAANALIENGPYLRYDQPESHEFFKELRKTMDRYPNAVLICDAQDGDYFGDDTNEFHTIPFFWLSYFLADNISRQNSAQVAEIVSQNIKEDKENIIFSVFLGYYQNRNGMRMPDMLGGSIEQCKVFASVQLTLPAVPFIHYGEEIGMSSVKKTATELNGRNPMQWSPGANAGFTTGTPAVAVNTNFDKFNVEVETADTNSILNHYKKLILLRNAHPALSGGDIVQVNNSRKDVIYSVLRTSGGDNVVVMVNFCNTKITAKLDFTGTAFEGRSLAAITDIFNGNEAMPALTAGNRQAYEVPVPAYGTRLILLK